MINTEQTSFFEKPGQIPLAARLRPEDFDAVFHLLSQSFPAGERRDTAGQRALLSDSAYRIDILRAPSGGVQALMPTDYFPTYKEDMEKAFGGGSCREIRLV